MQHLRILLAAGLVIAGSVAPHVPVTAADNRSREIEAYVPESLPSGFQIVHSELEGAVFADAAGHTLYIWPTQTQRNSNLGEVEGTPACYDVHYRETAGIQIPYPAGLELPNADHRPTCIQYWPPVFAPAGAKPMGNWTILDRTDGTKQWAYKNFALYTSHLDKRAGDTYGGSMRDLGKDPVSSGALRRPAKPAPAVPPEFKVVTKVLGRLLVTKEDQSVYYYHKDTPNKSNCTGSCLEKWEPILASDIAVAHDQWSLLVRPEGTRQWVFRGKPLYRYLKFVKKESYDGEYYESGWQNVFTYRVPAPPSRFQTVDTDGGQILANADGKTIYYYSCVEDTLDSLLCDTPDAPQEYRLAVCGAGDIDRCLQTFPYLRADKGEKSHSSAWSIIDIDPKTGRYATNPDTSLRVWAYRGRPLYTFARDSKVGDIGADAWGVAFGHQNGFQAIWVRDAVGQGVGTID